jgi:hypothetical protein
MSSLVIIGKEAADQVREDITLGHIAPAVGADRSYADGTDPNTKYSGTTWIQNTTTKLQYKDGGEIKDVVLVRWTRLT